MTKTTTIVVPGLCCATEEATISRKLRSLKGIEELSFNVVTKRLEVRHSCDESDILSGLRDVGLPGSVERERRALPKSPVVRKLFVSTIGGASLFATGLILSAMSQPDTITVPLFLFAILLSGWQVGVRAVKAAVNLSLDMNFLMAIAVVGAVGIGEYAEGSAVIVLFAVSLLLESLSTDRSRHAVESLMRLSPATATLRLPDRELSVPVEVVPEGETMIIRPGERVPLDGIVTAGSSSVDQSAITGESVPESKSPGDLLYAGSFNQRGVLEARVTRKAGDSTIAHIVQLVEQAHQQKAPTQTFVERFARVYTPAVFLLAVGVALAPPLLFGGGFETWFYRALVLLVIACPCALVISTPVTVINAITNAARNGVLIKGGKHLEALAHVRAVALDKTGTITQGRISITDVIGVNSLPTSEIVRISAAIEARSEHHLADAFLRKAEADGLDFGQIEVRDFVSIPGKGVQGTVNGTLYVLGNHPLVEELGQCTPALERTLQRLETDGKTAIVLFTDQGPVGVIGVSDMVREEGSEAVRQLHRLGVVHVSLLTGDNRGTASAVARPVGFDDVRSELLPEAKLDAIRDLRSRYGRVAMVGDGVNDAPALAAADVGIAMGGVGSDTALETADVVLMSDNLLQIPRTIALGKKALSVIKQNIFIALATKALFLVLGLMGLTSLWLAILADDGATLVVVLNSLRLLRSNSPIPGKRVFR